MIINELPESERPEYKIRMNGVESLSNIELIALVTGMKSLSGSYGLLRDVPHGIYGLSGYDTQGFEKMGLTKRQAERLYAAIEIGIRIAEHTALSKTKILNPEMIADMFIPRLRHKKQEHLIVLCLNARGELMSEHTVGIGGKTSALGSPDIILRPAVLQGASSIVLIHNHPSGNPEPSTEDISVADRIDTAAGLLGIKLCDSMIIGDGIYHSIRESHADMFRPYIDRLAAAADGVLDLTNHTKETRGRER
jgi:DNA repair protein RadC